MFSAVPIIYRIIFIVVIAGALCTCVVRERVRHKADLLTKQAAVCIKEKRYADAERLYKSALRKYRCLRLRNGARFARVRLAALYELQNRFSEAIPMDEKVAALDEKRYPNSLTSLDSTENLACDYYLAGEFEKAVPAFQKAEELSERLRNLPGRDDLERGSDLEKLGFVYERLGRDAEAERCFSRVVDLRQNGPHPETSWSSMLALSLIYGSHGETARAENLLEHYYETYDRSLMPGKHIQGYLSAKDALLAKQTIAQICHHPNSKEAWQKLRDEFYKRNKLIEVGFYWGYYALFDDLAESDDPILNPKSSLLSRAK